MHGGSMLAKRIQDKWGVEVVLGGNNAHYLVQFQKELTPLWDAMKEFSPYLCVGPGEKMMAEFAKMLEAGGIGRDKYRAMPGAVWAEDGVVKANHQDIPTLAKPSFEGLDLDEDKVCMNAGSKKEAQILNEMHFLKWPHPHPLTASDINRRFLPENERVETLLIPYIFNYNCPYRCAFCVQSGDDKKRVVAKPIGAILDEIEELIKEHNSKFFYFFNNTFNYSAKFAREFCEGALERKLEFYWTDCARFNNLTPELVELMQKAGCRKLVFGFETGSEKLLKLFDKRLDLSHARNVLKWCKEAGIWADIEVIVGLPYELEEDFQQTVEFIKENREFINHYALNRYFVVPDSLIGSKPENYGVRLVRVKNRYEALLQKNREFFIGGSERASGAMNFQVFRYNEVDGRKHSEIVAATEGKVRRLNEVYLTLPIAQEIRLLELRKQSACGVS
jgi:radical SAM superfamily enzyme YgiQ (UPF0313 family)